jgi:hypothetical protein
LSSFTSSFSSTFVLHFLRISFSLA